MASRSAGYHHHVPPTVTALLRAADQAQEHQRADEAESIVDWVYVLLEEEVRTQAWHLLEARVA